jgi:F0F1-type ATP synthase epsilon subunit
MTFALHILTPTATFFEGEVKMVTLMLGDGVIQFLAHHSEELSSVVDGKASMTMADDTKVEFCTSGGIFYFDGKEGYLMCEHVAYHRDWDDKLQARADYLKQEQLRRKQSAKEHLLSTIALNKAFVAMHHPTRKDSE